MSKRYVDISVPLMAGIASDPPAGVPQIEYRDHHMTAKPFADYFGVPLSALPNGEYCASERCNISTHNGTHIDAPYHYFSSMNHRLKEGGERSASIDELPLEWFMQPAVKIDCREYEDGYVLQPSDLEAEFKKIGHKLRPLEIVVMNTRAGMRYGEDDYVDTGCGFGKAATLWLLDQGVRVVGTDAWSWDAPFSHTRRKVQETGDYSLIWEGHRAGREIGYSQIEKLHNLEALPADGFEIACFPVKVHRGSAGWTRAVAILPE